MIDCKNCKTNFEGTFCPNCAQKVITKRFQLKDSILWIFSSIFNFDKGFLYTSRELIMRPGQVINNFLQGITIRYSHPFRFIFIWSTISAIIGVYLNVFEESGLMFNKMMGQSEEEIERIRKVMTVLKQYMSFIIMGMIPFLALGSYIVMKGKKLNYAEHLILMSYSNGISTAIGLPIIFCYFFIDDTQLLGTTNLVLSTVVIGRVFARTFHENWIIGILKYILSFFTGFLIMMITLFIVLIAVIFTMKGLGMSNPFN